MFSHPVKSLFGRTKRLLPLSRGWHCPQPEKLFHLSADIAAEGGE